MDTIVVQDYVIPLLLSIHYSLLQSVSAFTAVLVLLQFF